MLLAYLYYKYLEWWNHPVISWKFLIKYYEYSFDYPIAIMNQLTINTHT